LNRLTAIAFCCIILGAAVCFFLESRAHLESSRQPQQRSDSRQPSQQEQGQFTVSRPAVNGGQDASNRNQQKDDDSVKWTDAIQALATVGSFLIAVLIYLMYDQHRQIMDRQAIASVIANENVRAIERAFVFLKDINEYVVHDNVPIAPAPQLQQSTPAAFFYEPRWENSGTTATKSMTVRVNWTVRDSGLPYDFEYPYDRDYRPPETMFLGPKMEMPSLPMTFAPEEIASVGRGIARIYIWGRVDYVDIFGAPHYTQFCYQLSVETAIGQPFGWRHRTYYGTYNRTDENDRA
jgi:hypothetical protein